MERGSTVSGKCNVLTARESNNCEREQRDTYRRRASRRQTHGVRDEGEGA